LYFRNVDLAHAVVQQFLGEAFEQGRFTDAAGATVSLSNTTVVMSPSQIAESFKHAHVGFVPHNGEGDEGRAATKERSHTAGLNESLAATIDEVVEFQVLDRAATERIIAERLDALKSRLESAQPVVVRLDQQLASFFAERLASERKSVAQIDRLLQDTIIIPFTNLHLDRRPAAVRPEIKIRIDNGAVKVDASM
jgi:ATP-dependent Clp protease ATP-binding subunit ClpA